MTEVRCSADHQVAAGATGAWHSGNNKRHLSPVNNLGHIASYFSPCDRNGDGRRAWVFATMREPNVQPRWAGRSLNRRKRRVEA